MLLYSNKYLQYSEDVYSHPEYNDMIKQNKTKNKKKKKKIISTIIRAN